MASSRPTWAGGNRAAPSGPGSGSGGPSMLEALAPAATAALKRKAIKDLSDSSVLDLKTELLRTATTYKRLKAAAVPPDELGVISTELRDLKKAPPLPALDGSLARSNRGVAERGQRDLDQLETPGSQMEASWVALTRKAALYQELQAKGGLSDDDSDGESGRKEGLARGKLKSEDLLVDFLAKPADHSESGPGDTPSPFGAEDDPWVETLDEFGRARLIRKSQLEGLTPTQSFVRASSGSEARRFGQPSTSEDRPTMVSADMAREQERQDWERDAAQAFRPAHFSSALENRTLGVGFYQFSQSETERAAQMSSLSNIRSQTLSSRDQAQAAKAATARKLEERKERIREKLAARKGKQKGAAKARAGAYQGFGWIDDAQDALPPPPILERKDPPPAAADDLETYLLHMKDQVKDDP